MGHDFFAGCASTVVYIAEVVCAFRDRRNGNDTVSRIEAGSTIVPCVNSAAGSSGQSNSGTFADDLSISSKGGGGTSSNCHCFHFGGVRAIDVTHLIGDGHAIVARCGHHEGRFGGITHGVRLTHFYPCVLNRGGTRSSTMEASSQHRSGAAACRSHKCGGGLLDSCK